MTDPKLALITLLVQLGVAAAVSSALARSRMFKNLLFAEHRTFAGHAFVVLLEVVLVVDVDRVGVRALTRRLRRGLRGDQGDEYPSDPTLNRPDNHAKCGLADPCGAPIECE